MPNVKESRKIVFNRGLSAGSFGSKGLSDVTLITGGVEALGHGLFVDEKSIEGLMGLLLGKTLPGYVTHEGAQYGDRLTEECGLFSGFYRDGLKLKAQQFTFLNSFIKHSAADYDKLMELAEKLPDQFGLSVVFSGEAVWPATGEDGAEVDADECARPEGCDQPYPSIRFKSVDSCDFVKCPACNPDGLFASVDAAAESMALDKEVLAKHTEALAAKDAELSALSASNASALEKLTADHSAALAAAGEEQVKALAAKDEEGKAALAAAKVETDKAIAERDAKIKELSVYDVRQSGASQAVAIAAQLGEAANPVVIPEPSTDNNARWGQYDELLKQDVRLAAAFKAKHLPTSFR